MGSVGSRLSRNAPVLMGRVIGLQLLYSKARYLAVCKGFFRSYSVLSLPVLWFCSAYSFCVQHFHAGCRACMKVSCFGTCSSQHARQRAHCRCECVPRRVSFCGNISAGPTASSEEYAHADSKHTTCNVECRGLCCGNVCGCRLQPGWILQPKDTSCRSYQCHRYTMHP